MTDPERLSKSSRDPLAALLLQAATEEKPSAAALHRATRAVAAAAAAGAAATAATNAGNAAAKLVGGSSTATAGAPAFKGATLGVGAVAKWIAIGALGGAAALSSVQALIAQQGPKYAGAARAPAANAHNATPSPQSTGRERIVPELIASTDAKEPERPNAVEAQRAQSPGPMLGDLAKPDASGRTDGPFLAAEVRFVDQGRATLQRHAFAEALDQLAPYERLFPHQQLLTEVLFLRMEAFRRLGNAERARALAGRVLTLGVVGRQAAQAREVLRP